jgi:hypothetical protein
MEKPKQELFVNNASSEKANEEYGYGPSIELSGDEGLKAALEKKLIEYGDRLEYDQHISNVYKYKILEKLLDEGSVIPGDLFRELDKDKEFNASTFYEVMEVVRNYVENEGVGNVGGTGLIGHGVVKEKPGYSDFVPREKTENNLPKDDIEDAVFVDGKISEKEGFVRGENEDKSQSRKIEFEDFETLEEVEKAFLAAKVVFTELAKHSNNEVEKVAGERMIHLFEDSTEHDKNLAKKHKEKYLKHLYLCVDRLKEGLSSSSSVSEKEKVSEDLTEEGRVVVEPESEERPVIATEKNEEKTDTPYKIARAELLQTKKDYQVKKETYDQALDNYYREEANASLFKKIGKNILGFQPDLPQELKDLEKAYKDQKGLYANSLNSVLVERGKVNYKNYGNEKGELITPENPLVNKPYESSSDSTKIAFARKFILKPNEQLLQKQEAIALSEAQKSRMNRILGLMSKNKWAVRAGVVTLAGLAGAMTGGLAAFAMGAGLQASKILAGTVSGGLAGGAVRKYKQGAVDEAIKAVGATTENIQKNFSIADLDKLEDSLVTAQKIKDEKISEQKKASILAAVVAGGAVSGAWHMADSGEVIANASEKINDATNGMGKVADSVWRDNPALADLVGGEASSAPGYQGEGVENPIKNEVTDVWNASAENADTFELSLTKEISIPNYGMDGAKTFEIILQDVKLLSSTNLPGTLSPSEIGIIDRFIHLTSADLLSAHPNMSESDLESHLFNKLQSRYGDEIWWKEGEITAIDIGEVKLNTLDKGDVVEVVAKDENISEIARDSSPVNNNVENTTTVTEGVESVREYTVVKGDTLWDIAEKSFAADLKGLTVTEKNQVLDLLLEKARTNLDLLKTINLKSGDVDLIYPKEEINLGPLGDELKRLVDLQKNGDLPSYQKQATLEIKTDSVAENRVPINFTKIATPIDLPERDAFAISADKVFNTPPPITPPNYFYDYPLDTIDRGENIVATPEKFPESPTSSNGNYFETPEYKKYVLEVFGTEKNFKLAFNNRISDVEKGTYDMFTRGIYDSPYNLLKSMTLEQIEKFDSRDSLDIRGDLGSSIKYETYLAWIQKINDIRASGVPYHPETRLSDLFSRYVVEEMVERTHANK